MLGRAGPVAIYTSGSLPEAEVRQTLNGLQLAAALDQGVQELRLHFDVNAPPLVTLTRIKCDLVVPLSSAPPCTSHSNEDRI